MCRCATTSSSDVGRYFSTHGSTSLGASMGVASRATMRERELELVHAVETAGALLLTDNHHRAAALDELQGFLSSHLHDADVVLVALRPHIASASEPICLGALGVLDNVLAHTLHMHALNTLSRSVAPAVLERVGDSAERVHTAAANTFVALARVVLAQAPAARVREADTPAAALERVLRDGLEAKSAHLRLRTVRLIVRIRAEAQLSLRPLLASLVACVGDADGEVRHEAREALAGMLGDAPAGARADLRRELEAQGIRDEVAQPLLDAVCEQQGAPPPLTQSGATRIPPELASVPDDDVRVEYAATAADLEYILQTLAQTFSGKETENNWQARERATLRIRGLLQGGAHREFPEAFVAGMHGIMDGVLRTLATLRTTLALHVIALVRHLALELGVELERELEAVLAALLRMAGGTKKIVASASQVGAATVLACIPLRIAHLHMLSVGISDKNAATRVHMCRHLGLVLGVHAGRKHALETHGGVEMIEKMLEKALGDPTLEVRNAARETYMAYHRLWSARADALLTVLAPSARRQLQSAVGKDSPARTPTRRTGASAAVLAAKRAARAATPTRPQQDADALAEEMDNMAISPDAKRRRMPRESVWHPGLDDAAPTDASVDLLGEWSGPGDTTLELDDLAVGPKEGDDTIGAPHTPAARAPAAPHVVSTPTPEHGASAGTSDARTDAPETPRAQPAREDSARESVTACSASTDKPDNGASETANHTTGLAPVSHSAAARWFVARIARLDASADRIYALAGSSDVRAALDALREPLESLPTEQDEWLSALAALYRLGEAYDALSAAGVQHEWLSCVLHATQREAPRTLSLGASDAMLEAWLARVDASAATPMLLAAIGGAAPSASTLGALGRVLALVPPEELPAVVPTCRDVLRTALQSSDTAERRAAVNAAVAGARAGRRLVYDALAPLSLSQELLLEVCVLLTVLYGRRWGRAKRASTGRAIVGHHIVHILHNYSAKG